MMAHATIKLPLHGGLTPSYLIHRMIRLSGAIAKVIVNEYGEHEFLRRLSDPLWFQAFGCVLGFDWHSSGITTTVTGALKEGLRGVEHELGIYSQGVRGRRRVKPRAKSVNGATGWLLTRRRWFTRAAWRPRSTAL